MKSQMSSKFGPIRPRTSELAALSVSKKSHRFKVGEMLLILIGSSSFLQVTRVTIKAWMSLNFSQIPPLSVKLAALECLKNPSFLIGSASFLQVTRITTKPWMTLNFSRIHH